MVTGYEVEMYRNIGQIAKSLRSIDESLKVLAKAAERSTTPVLITEKAE